MSKQRFSAKQLCDMFPNKYIAVRCYEKDAYNLIISCEVLKVYNSLDEVKSNVKEIKSFMDLYQKDFDVIFGKFTDYAEVRSNGNVMVIEDVWDAVNTFGFMGFEMFGYKWLDAPQEEE